MYCWYIIHRMHNKHLITEEAAAWTCLAGREEVKSDDCCFQCARHFKTVKKNQQGLCSNLISSHSFVLSLKWWPASIHAMTLCLTDFRKWGKQGEIPSLPSRPKALTARPHQRRQVNTDTSRCAALLHGVSNTPTVRSATRSLRN